MHNNQEARYYHAVNCALESSYKELGKLREKHGSWEAAWASIPPVKRSSDPEALWEILQDKNISLILKDDPLYPALLQEIPWPPFGLYIKGKLPDPHRTVVAIVGTRKATDAGKTAAHEFAQELAKSGIVIISGLAFGIDAAAHSGCLEAGGTTVAVLAQGLDRVYPTSHAHLAEKILAQSGALISEYPPGSPTLPYRFLERNRIVSGLSAGVLVIEAPSASGSLATARFALEQNRDVFVIPGPMKHPNFKGSHDLIRSGATLVTEPTHIFEALGIENALITNEEATFSSPEETTIFHIIKESGSPISVDKIVELSKLRTQIVNQTLTLLILKNAIKETNGGYTL